MTDDGWGSNDAKVVCQQLGYPTDGQTWNMIKVTLQSKADNDLFFLIQGLSTLVVLTLAQEMDPFSWTMWHAMAMKHHSYLVRIPHQLQVMII